MNNLPYPLRRYTDPLRREPTGDDLRELQQLIANNQRILPEEKRLNSLFSRHLRAAGRDDYSDMDRKHLASSGLLASLTGLNVSVPVGKYSGSRTFRRWIGAHDRNANIPYAIWMLLIYLAGYGHLWFDKSEYASTFKERDVPEGLRSVTLVPAAIWERPTRDEMRLVELLIAENLGIEKPSGQAMNLIIAEFTGLSVDKTNTSRTYRRYLEGKLPLPYAVWVMMVYMAGLGFILDKDL